MFKLALSFLRRKARYLFALLLGICGVFAFSPFDLWPFAFIAIIGLQLVILNCTAKQAAWAGFFWAVGLFSYGFSWIYVSIQQFGNMPVIASIGMILLLACYSALYPMLYAYLLSRCWPTVSFIRLVIAAPALWQITEFLRGWVMTGFPWLQFGYSQIDGPLRGLAPLGGVESITYIMFILCGLLTYSLYRRKVVYTIAALALTAIIWPLHYLSWFQSEPQRAVNITLVQGNIDQRLKWMPGEREKIINTYLDTSLPYFNDSQIIIWPEAAIPDVELRQEDFLISTDELARQHQTTLLTGIIEANLNNQRTVFYNSLIVLGDDKPYRLLNENRYRKHHLVLFGEYVPLEKFLRPIGDMFNLPMSSISSGDLVQPALQVAGYKLTPAICYEIILGEQIRKNFQPDTDFLLTISNDAWFGDSIGPWQHFQMARMRALEFGRPLIRATNTGITAFIDANGSIADILPQFEQNVLPAKIAPTKGTTPYTRFGYLPLWLLTALMLGFAYLRKGHRQ